MLPDNVLSTDPHPARFFGARAGATSKTVDYEDGGRAIQDPSQGLLYQRWRGRILDAGRPSSRIVLSAREVPEFTWLERGGLSEISFTFDASMRPTVVYVADDLPYLQWFDSLVNDYVTTALPAGVTTPRVSLDDKRYLGSFGYQLSDVILAYVRDGNLYYRQQRDRYDTERLLREDVTPLIKIGFNRGLRLQFMMEVSS